MLEVCVYGMMAKEKSEKENKYKFDERTAYWLYKSIRFMYRKPKWRTADDDDEEIEHLRCYNLLRTETYSRKEGGCGRRARATATGVLCIIEYIQFK